MYCGSCGRETEDTSSCLHNSKLTIYDRIFLYILIVLFPITVFVFMYGYTSDVFLNGQYMFVGNLTLVIILTILLLAFYLFNKGYIVLFFSCHQMTTRSFRIKGKYFFLCSRCTGILISIFISIFLTRYSIVHETYYLLVIAAGLPLLVDGLLQRFSQYKSTNIVRFITGLLFGPTIILLYSVFQIALLRVFVVLMSYFY